MGEPGSESPDEVELSDEELLAALMEGETPESDITELRHVRSAAERRAAEEVATRKPCDDFDRFRPVFEQIQRDLDTGARTTRPPRSRAEIKPGSCFILGGQKAYVAEMGKTFIHEYGEHDARLRVVFDNGTESNLLVRSLQRALNKDVAGRLITDQPGTGRDPAR